VDIRRSQTNRTVSLHSKHDPNTYDFLVAWIPNTSAFYIMPSVFADSFSGGITVYPEGVGSRGRAVGKAIDYANAWHLIV
jgi:hypothetical protein